MRVTLTKRTLDLLRYLLLHTDRPQRREHLAELFWGESGAGRSRSALNSAVWRIRGALEPHDDLSIVSDASTLAVRVGPSVRIDAVELGDAYRAAADDPAAEARLAAAVDACDAPFLDGSTDDWALVEREKFFELRMRSLVLLMRRCGAARRFDDAAAFGRRLLAEDPFRESVHCELMWLYMLSGRRAKALAQYQWCARKLREELGIEPMAELRALYDHIRDDLSPVAGRAASRAGGRAEHRIDAVLDAIERARLELYSVLCEQHN